MKQFLRRLLWRCLGRDFMVLRPDWAVLSRTEDHLIAGPRHDSFLLPVSYNQTTEEQWKLHYRVRGAGHGQLRYILAAPGKAPFCDVTRPSHLPCEWTVELRHDTLTLDGQMMSLLPGHTLPLDTPWLCAQLTFKPSAGPTLTRQTGHRVRHTAPADPDYYNGAVYDDYNSDALADCHRPLDVLSRFGPLRGRLLDVGCATGLLVKNALDRGLDAEGIDGSPWAIGQANRRTAQRCRVLNLERATTNDFSGAYQFIVFQSVLEHLSDPAGALRLLHNLLAPGGRIYVQTLNADSLSHRLLGPDWTGFNDPTHQSPWITADWLKRAADDLGFEPLHLRRYGFWNDNKSDPVWRAFQSLIQLQPACALLEDNYGDFVEAVLGKPDRAACEPPRIA